MKTHQHERHVLGDAGRPEALQLLFGLLQRAEDCLDDCSGAGGEGLAKFMSAKDKRSMYIYESALSN